MFHLNSVDCMICILCNKYFFSRHLDVFARTSGVFGAFGEGTEYGGGLNWYIRGNQRLRATAEAKRINHSSASNVLSGYFAGQTGTLLQLQLQTDF